MAKTLTIKQPHASLIVEGIKDIENRTWKTNYRGRILIHAGSAIDSKERSETDWHYRPLTFEQYKSAGSNGNYSVGFGMTHLYPRKSIIGSVEIVDCVINHPSIWAERTDVQFNELHGLKPIYNWVLSNPIKFENPIINVKGKLSLWNAPYCGKCGTEIETGASYCKHCCEHDFVFVGSVGDGHCNKCMQWDNQY